VKTIAVSTSEIAVVSIHYVYHYLFQITMYDWLLLSSCWSSRLFMGLSEVLWCYCRWWWWWWWWWWWLCM